FSALNVLYTLSFAYPRRETYFQNELAQFLVLNRDAHFDPLAVKSSYAGALGMPQFMPSAYRQYAVASGHHYPNLFSNPDDVILSVGHYFAKMGWQKGMPVALQAIDLHDQPIPDAFVNQSLSLKAFAHAGIVPVNLSHPKRDENMQAKLLKLQGVNGPEYWFVFHNFNVIKRYNASDLYAMTVFHLGQFVSSP
ncbi:MAG: lytic murein transglycosylase, partial [Gammaproteobacteria bacterium]|nr:lytic murein transglycosylase [Gammaproteobacteria bacterium]